MVDNYLDREIPSPPLPFRAEAAKVHSGQEWQGGGDNQTAYGKASNPVRRLMIMLIQGNLVSGILMFWRAAFYNNLPKSHVEFSLELSLSEENEKLRSFS